MAGYCGGEKGIGTIRNITDYIVGREGESPRVFKEVSGLERNYEKAEGNVSRGTADGGGVCLAIRTVFRVCIGISWGAFFKTDLLFLLLPEE